MMPALQISISIGVFIARICAAALAIESRLVNSSTTGVARPSMLAQKEAEAAGADFVGPEYVAKIKEGWLDCDVVIATPDMMGQVGPLGRVLGPRGLMPNPKSGTVTMDVTRAVNEVKAGKIEFRVDKTGNLHAPMGKVSFSAEQLNENLATFMDAVVRARPSAAKGTYIRSVTVSSTMGPGVHVDPAVYR